MAGAARHLTAIPVLNQSVRQFPGLDFQDQRPHIPRN